MRPWLRFITVLALASAAWADSATQPLRAIAYRHEVRENPTLQLHSVIVNTRDPDVRVVVRPGGEDPDGRGEWQTTLKTTSDVAKRDRLAVAVNGDFFAAKDTRQVAGKTVRYYEGNWARAQGYAMSDGKLWSAGSNRFQPRLVVHADGSVEVSASPKLLPDDARQVVSGSHMLVEDGKVTPQKNKDLHPRTAAGVTADGKLVLLVVDGRQKGFSIGLSLEELGKEMARLGCKEALNLDGGGSSTLVMREMNGEFRIRNRPSDGHDLLIPLSVERPVANVLGVILKEGNASTRPVGRVAP